MSKPERYIVVLAHGDGWGVRSANKVVRHIAEQYPDLGVFLVASHSTKNKRGEILTRIDDLKVPRVLRETCVLDYFNKLDAFYQDCRAENINIFLPESLTFNELGFQFCTDQKAHYTSRGGFKGGLEVLDILRGIEAEYGGSPEFLLSTDTMAILPPDIVDHYHCFSTHPGPLNDVQIAGMQGTVRSYVNGVYFDAAGKLLPRDHQFGTGMAFLKGTLFLQGETLDEGPPIAETLSYVCPGMCGYQMRAEVYHSLSDKMLEMLPIFMDVEEREHLVAEAKARQKARSGQPVYEVPELTNAALEAWQQVAYGFPSDDGMHGVDVVQNLMVSPVHFKSQMRRHFPFGDKITEQTFNAVFEEAFASELDRLAGQALSHQDPWARYYSGDPDVVIKHHDPKTGEVIAEFSNQGGEPV